MFQFTTTTIINANKALDVQGNQLLDSNGEATIEKFSATADKLTVFGTGTFNKHSIRSIYRHNHQVGALETIKITIPAAATKYEVGDVLRLEINVKLDGRVQSDYTNFQGDFTRPVTVDVLALATPKETADELAKLIRKLRIEYGYSLVSATAATDASGVLTIKARENGQLLTAKLSKIGELSGTKMMPVITKLADSTVATSGKASFGDTNWMLRSVTLPTYENTRHFGMLRDERPIVGDFYDQFTVKLVVDSGEEGVWNGAKKSVTTHVFWVNSKISDDFEAVLKTVFADVELVNTSKAGATGESESEAPKLKIAGLGTMRVDGTQTFKVEGAKGAIEWTSGTPATATIVEGTGVATAKAVGSTVIKATVDGQELTFNLSVIAKK